ncbi:hypothetical protein QCA50_011031 [Cerrena zonata]|uniref:Uncharacterized protein n=1 Tax=Cerrena zonata TaxID=2478898 RepID=A0AAW0G002_9APHY
MDPEHKVSDEGVESPRPTTPTTESQDAVEQNKSRPSTPPESAEGKELRLSRKREREVSLEPSTPQATSSDVEPSSESREKDRDRRKPAKKYRTSGQLDSTQEEGDDVGLADASSGESASNTPPGSLPRGVRTPPKRRRSSQHGHTGTPRRGHSQHGQEGDAMISDVGAVSSSPPMETKVRMISRGVEDLTWKGGQTSQANEGAGDIILAEQDVQQQQTPPRSDDGKEDHESMDHEPTPAASQAEDKVVEESVTVPVPPGLNPPLAEDVPIGEDEHGGQADPAEVPAEAQPEATESLVPEDQKDAPTESQEVQVIEQPSESTSTSTSPTFPTPPLSASTVSTVESTTRKGSPPPNHLPRKRSQAFADTSSAESQSAGVKRKLGDRAVSDAQVPELEELDRRAKRRTPSPPVEQSKKEEEQQNDVKSTKEEEVAQEESLHLNLADLPHTLLLIHPSQPLRDATSSLVPAAVFPALVPSPPGQHHLHRVLQATPPTLSPQAQTHLHLPPRLLHQHLPVRAKNVQASKPLQTSRHSVSLPRDLNPPPPPSPLHPPPRRTLVDIAIHIH